jgi:hypothetical protein
MSFFTAVVLVCQLSTTPTGVCDESNAIDVISTHVNSELGCSLGWQEIIARGSLKEDMDKDLYVKTICRRSLQASIETAK